MPLQNAAPKQQITAILNNFLLEWNVRAKKGSKEKLKQEWQTQFWVWIENFQNPKLTEEP